MKYNINLVWPKVQFKNRLKLKHLLKSVSTMWVMVEQVSYAYYIYIMYFYFKIPSWRGQVFSWIAITTWNCYILSLGFTFRFHMQVSLPLAAVATHSLATIARTRSRDGSTVYNCYIIVIIYDHWLTVE